MIRKNCDNCDRVIEVPDDQAGEKIACPECGDINVIPASAPAAAPAAPGSSKAEESGAAVDRAVAAGYPPDSGPEQKVMMVRPAMFRARPMVFSACAVGLVGGLVGVIYFGLIADTRNWILWPCLVLGLVLLGVFATWKIQVLSAALEVTNKRAVERRGLLSRSTSEVLHDSIRNVTIKQSFWERIWSVGEIGIASSGHEGIEINIRNIPHPDKVRKIIDLYRPL